MNSIIPPPIKLAIADIKSGIVDIVWTQFFLGIYRMFSQPSYGSKGCTFTITGITGTYTTDYSVVTDRDFVHFNYTITPNTGTKMAIKNATMLPVFDNNQNPLKINNVMISLLEESTIKDFRLASVDTNGVIKIPNSILTRYTLKINGTFIKTF